MDLLRVGRSLRALRIRRGMRQEDVGVAAGMSRSQVARIERGESVRVAVGTLDAVARALGADLDVRVRWQGEGMDRLLDAAHAALVEALVRRLRALGWEVAVEVSFNLAGERGAIDVLAYRGATGIVLVIEVKSTIPDAQTTISVHDRKARLAARIAAERGWAVRAVARLLVVGSDPTARRRVQELDATFGSVYPARGTAVRRWLAAPSGSLAGLLFVSYGRGVSVGRARPWRQRVRRRQRPPGER